jgi:hypothetical protein
MVTMSQEKLLSDLQESRAETQRLRDRLSIGTPTIHKDLSLISLIPKWSGLESAISLEEFISNIEGAAELGRWQNSDCVRIAALKFTDLARSFYNTCQEFRVEDTTWQIFKDIFRQRFKRCTSRSISFHEITNSKTSQK